MEKKQPERRENPRSVFPCKIVIFSSQKVINSHTENISKGGIKIILPECLDKLSKVRIELSLERDLPIKCEGMVMWVRDSINPLENKPVMFHTGIMFTTISEEDKDYISDLATALGD